MKRTISLILAAVAAVAAVALAGCSSPAPKQAPVETVTLPAAPSQASPTCIPVSSAMGQSIMSKATPGSGARFTKAVAVKSPDFSRVYFIALQFSAGDVENQVAVFASSELTPVGAPIMAVDAVAQQVTDWPDADKSKAAISKSDPYAMAAKACLK
jgi:hypothetical protein